MPYDSMVWEVVNLFRRLFFWHYDLNNALSQLILDDGVVLIEDGWVLPQPTKQPMQSLETEIVIVRQVCNQQVLGDLC